MMGGLCQKSTQRATRASTAPPTAVISAISSEQLSRNISFAGYKRFIEINKRPLSTRSGLNHPPSALVFYTLAHRNTLVVFIGFRVVLAIAGGSATKDPVVPPLEGFTAPGIIWVSKLLAKEEVEPVKLDRFPLLLPLCAGAQCYVYLAGEECQMSISGLLGWFRPGLPHSRSLRESLLRFHGSLHSPF